MKKHEVLFFKIKDLLKANFGSDLKEFDDGTHLTVSDSGVWISCDDSELTIGHGFTHNHYNPAFDNLSEAVENFFDLLTKRKRITSYYKGSFQYKNTTEFALSDSAYKHIGTSMTWVFPYWKKTKKKVKFIAPLIDSSTIWNEMEEIKNYAQQSYSLTD